MTAPQIILHIGAHKTATTHLQRSIDAHKGTLRDRGVAFFGPRDLRYAEPTLAERFGIGPGQGDVTQLQALAMRDRMRGGAERLVLSEENFIGGVNNRWGRVSLPLYRDAGARLAELCGKIAPDGLTLALSVRHPATFMSSAYVQHLMAGGRTGVQRLQGSLDPGKVDWPDLVKRLTRVPGVARLVVWRYEDYGALFPAITRTLLGDASDVVTPIPGRVHDGLSQRAVDHVNADLAGDGAVEIARAKYPLSDGHAPFSHFDARTVARIDKLYARQVAQIAKLDRVTLLKPDAPEG